MKTLTTFIALLLAAEASAQTASKPAVRGARVDAFFEYSYQELEAAPDFGAFFFDPRASEQHAGGGTLLLTLPIFHALAIQVSVGGGGSHLESPARFFGGNDSITADIVTAGLSLLLRDPDSGFVEVGYGFDPARGPGDWGAESLMELQRELL